MSTAKVRTILPLAIITCTGMLAMDLFLPALPTLQQGLGLSVPQGQATVSLFLVGLAGSQLVWGEALHRHGPRACVRAGLWVLVLASFGCALAQGATLLLALRFVQGIAAGAAAVVAPTVIRATLPDRDGVRGIAAIAMIEAIVPAAAPVLGTLLLLVADWRWTFVVVGATTLLSIPFALRVTPRSLPGHDDPVATGYLALARDARYRRLAGAHALCIGALITFVASAPQVLVKSLRMPTTAFATLQVCGVASFMLMASQSGRIATRMSTPAVIRIGAAAHAAWCVGFLVAANAGPPGFAWILCFWMVFCGTLGVRGPATFSDALAVPPAQMGRASAVLVLLILMTSAAGTQLAAVFLEAWGMTAVAAVMSLFCLASLALVARHRTGPSAGPRLDMASTAPHRVDP